MQYTIFKYFRYNWTERNGAVITRWRSIS